MNLFFQYASVSDYICAVLLDNGNIYFKLFDILKHYNYASKSGVLNRYLPGEKFLKYYNLCPYNQSKEPMATPDQIFRLIGRVRRRNEQFEAWFLSVMSGTRKFYHSHFDLKDIVGNSDQDIYLQLGHGIKCFSLTELIQEHYSSSQNLYISPPDHSVPSPNPVTSTNVQSPPPIIEEIQSPAPIVPIVQEITPQKYVRFRAPPIVEEIQSPAPIVPIVQEITPQKYVRFHEPLIDPERQVNESSFFVTDIFGVKYKYMKCDINWHVKDNRPVNIAPIYKTENEKIYMYYPIKIE